MPVKIFVGNLTAETTGDHIRPLFERYGHVTECDVLMNFGFVHMEKEDEANVAIEELAGSLVNGQRINVEKSTGTSRGGGRGGGGRMMSGGRGRGRGSFGGPSFRGRVSDSDRDPYAVPRPHPYAREPYPYDYYDRGYPLEHPLPRGYPPDDRRAVYDRDRLPLPRDYYDRYPSAQYPLPTDRYAAYDLYPPRPLDPYDRPPRPADPYKRPSRPADLYERPSRPADPYERPSRPADLYERPPRPVDPYERPSRPADLYERPSRPADPFERPPPDYYRARQSVDKAMPTARPVFPSSNGLEDRRLKPSEPPGESYSSSYSSYYDRFYSKPPTNGEPQISRHGAPQPGRPPVPSAISRSLAAAAARKDQQAALQTGPIFF